MNEEMMNDAPVVALEGTGDVSQQENFGESIPDLSESGDLSLSAAISPDEEIGQLTASINETQSGLASIRESLGLPPVDEVPPSMLSDQERLDELIVSQEQGELSTENSPAESGYSEGEVQRMIEEEKQNILQEKLSALVSEIQSDLENIIATGRHGNGGQVGQLSPSSAQELGSGISEGLSLNDLLERSVGLLAELEAEITQEAEARVRQRIDSEKSEEKTEDSEEPEEQVEEILEQDTAGGAEVQAEGPQNEVTPVTQG